MSIHEHYRQAINSSNAAFIFEREKEKMAKKNLPKIQTSCQNGTLVIDLLSARVFLTPATPWYHDAAIFEGVSGGLLIGVRMMPRDVSLSDGCFFSDPYKNQSENQILFTIFRLI